MINARWVRTGSTLHPVEVVEVEVWWGRPSQQLPWHADLLDATERRRRAAFRRPADQARFTVATAVLKLAAGQRLGLAADRVTIDRTCADCGRPHGRPRLPGHDLAASISHSGDRVLVGLTGGAPVGVDVEEISRVDPDELAGHVLGTGEAAPTRPEFFCYWTRKEAVVKATGDGLRMPLSEVVVTPPGEPPRLLRYGDRAELATCLADLDGGDGYAAAVAVLGAGPLRVHRRDATALLTP
ncbi:MAG: 4'-phosphopantetheinyl transferase superfamily protein [Micromonosporaceae bacterium]|nr:4'-phosphopantetheinyl transferase superfamily protein [Micromonosporaceae bacterium]